MDPVIVILVSVVAVLVLTTVIVILSRYRKCPSDKILVVYGKVGSNKDGTYRSAKCIHGGAAFIMLVPRQTSAKSAPTWSGKST